jgi:hypothetical protein
MSNEKKVYWMGIAAVVLVLISVTMSGWSLYQLSMSSVVAPDSSINATEASVTESQENLVAHQDAFEERIGRLEAYIALRAAMEWSPPWIQPTEEQALGMQYKIPGYWTWEEVWEERIESECVSMDDQFGCTKIVTSTRSEFVIRPAVSEFQGDSIGSIVSEFTSGCVIHDDQEWIASLESRELGQLDPGDVNLMAREPLEGSSYPATRLLWGLPNAAYREDIIIELPQKNLLMRAGGVDSDTSYMGRAIQQIVFETCLKIAKTIEPLQVN